LSDRRQFLKDVARSAGVVIGGCCLSRAPLHAQSGNAKNRRKVTVGGRPVRTIDIHAHVVIPEATALMGQRTAPNDATVMGTARFSTMDEWGTDMQALSINPTWYALEQDLARKVIQIQNEKLAEICAKYLKGSWRLPRLLCNFRKWRLSNSRRAFANTTCAAQPSAAT